MAREHPSAPRGASRPASDQALAAIKLETPQHAADERVRMATTLDPITAWKRRNQHALDGRGEVLLGPSENEMGDERGVPYCQVLPPEAIQDWPCEVSRDVSDRAKHQARGVIAAVIASGTCGRVDNPTDEDFYAGLRADEPTATQNAAIDTWLREATHIEILNAMLCGCYTPRELARAVARRGLGLRCDTARATNLFCLPEWWDTLEEHDPWYDGR